MAGHKISHVLGDILVGSGVCNSHCRKATKHRIKNKRFSASHNFFSQRWELQIPNFSLSQITNSAEQCPFGSKRTEFERQIRLNKSTTTRGKINQN